MSAVLAKLRTWYPEVLAAAILIAVGFAGQRDDPLFAVFEGVVVAIGWGMCARHKHLPLHDKLNRVGRDVEQVRDLIIGAVAEAEDDEPSPSAKLYALPTSGSSAHRKGRSRARA